jgi:hypothetical protein
VDFPHVAVVPGPTSLPGGLIVCASLPGGVIGPVNASAFANTLPPITEVICYFKFNWSEFKSSELSYKLRKFSHEAISLSTKNHLQSLRLPLTGFLIEKERCSYLCITTCPDITNKSFQVLTHSIHQAMFHHIGLSGYATREHLHNHHKSELERIHMDIAYRIYIHRKSFLKPSNLEYYYRLLSIGFDAKGTILAFLHLY